MNLKPLLVLVLFPVICPLVFTQNWSFLEQGIAIELDDPFYTPLQLDFDRQGNMYIADRKAGHIYKIAPDGTLLFGFSGKGEGPGELEYLADIAIDRTTNTIWAMDFRKYSISSFDTDGVFLNRYFVDLFPKTFALQSGNRIVFSSAGEPSSLVLTDREGQILKAFGHRFSNGYSEKDLLNTTNLLFVDHRDRLYTATWRGNLIQAFDAQQNLLWQRERDWTNDRIKPEKLRYLQKENRLQSSTWHTALFVVNNILYVATDYEEENLLAFDAGTGKYLGYRAIGFRIRNAKVFRGNLYALESENAVLRVFKVDDAPRFETISSDKDFHYRSPTATKISQ